MERRSELRLQVNIATEIKELITPSDSVICPPRLGLRVTNISVQGIRFTLDSYVPKYMIFCFDLPIGEDIIPVQAKVVWHSILYGKQTYGCTFLASSMDIWKMQKIRQYIEANLEKKEGIKKC